MSKKNKKNIDDNQVFVNAIINGNNTVASKKLEQILAKKVARRIKETLG